MPAAAKKERKAALAGAERGAAGAALGVGGAAGGGGGGGGVRKKGVRAVAGRPSGAALGAAVRGALRAEQARLARLPRASRYARHRARVVERALALLDKKDSAEACAEVEELIASLAL